MTDAKQNKPKRRGSDWEAAVAVENEGLALNGEARIVRAWEAARRAPRKNPDGTTSFILVAVKGHAEPDFSGLLKGGRHIAFDAKRTTKHRFALPNPTKSAGWHHQIRALSAITVLGGIGFVYLLRDDLDDRFNRERYVLPVRDGKVAGHDPRVDRSILLTDVEHHRVPRSKMWLDVVLSNLELWQ